MAETEIVILEPVQYQRQLYEPGAVLSMPEAFAEPLIALGAAERAKKPARRSRAAKAKAKAADPAPDTGADKA